MEDIWKSHLPGFGAASHRKQIFSNVNTKRIIFVQCILNILLIQIYKKLHFKFKHIEWHNNLPQHTDKISDCLCDLPSFLAIDGNLELLLLAKGLTFDQQLVPN